MRRFFPIQFSAESLLLFFDVVCVTKRGKKKTFAYCSTEEVRERGGLPHSSKRIERDSLIHLCQRNASEHQQQQQHELQQLRAGENSNCLVHSWYIVDERRRRSVCGVLALTRSIHSVDAAASGQKIYTSMPFVREKKEFLRQSVQA